MVLATTGLEYTAATDLATFELSVHNRGQDQFQVLSAELVLDESRLEATFYGGDGAEEGVTPGYVGMRWDVPSAVGKRLRTGVVLVVSTKSGDEPPTSLEIVLIPSANKA